MTRLDNRNRFTHDGLYVGGGMSFFQWVSLCNGLTPRCWREVRAILNCDPVELAEGLYWEGRAAAFIETYFAKEEDFIPRAVLMVSRRGAGNGFASFLTTRGCGPYQPKITEMLRMRIGLLSAEFHRVETRVMARYRPAVRWIEALGAQRECTIEGLGVNGEDFHQYAWRRGCV